VSFLSPLFLVGIAAAAVPILLHLLKRQPEVSVKFPAVRMLRQAPVEQMSRRRLRELLLLALRVGALVLLSLAFARPFLTGETAAASSGVTVVAVDASLSLNAPGRMERARELARQAIDGAPGDHAVGVITFAEAATIAAEPSGDRAVAAAAVNAAEAEAGGTRYRAAIEAAAGLVAAHGDGTGRIVVVTDLQAGGWDQGDRVLLPEGVAVETIDVGALPPNLALLGTRPAGEGRIAATIANFSDDNREIVVRASTGGSEVAQTRLSVAAGQSAEALLEGVTAESVSVQIADADGLQGDNERFLVMRNTTPPPVLLVTSTGALDREAFYAQQAIGSSGTDGAEFTVEGSSPAALSSLEPGALDRFAAVVITSTRGLERRGRDLLAAFIERGGGVLLALGPDVDGAVAPQALGVEMTIAMPASDARDPRGDGRAVVSVDVRHPVFRDIGGGAGMLATATFQRIADIDGTACTSLARFTTGEPAFLECERGQGRVMLFASDLDHAWNDLPRHAVFVPLLHETIRYLSTERSAMDELLVGQTADAKVPGLLMRSDASGMSRLVAVNVDPRESAPDRLTPEAFSEAISAVPGVVPVAVAEARQQEARHDIWRWALLAMMAMLIAESALASRAA